MEMEVACVLIPSLTPVERGLAFPVAGVPPVDAAELTELLARRLEEIGAAVEIGREGEAFFAIDGLRGIHGGDAAGVLAAARAAAAMPLRIGVAPTRFAARAAAGLEPRAGEPGGEPVVSAGSLRGFLSRLPTSALVDRLGLPEREAGNLVETMQRLGIDTLGALAALPPHGIADRFGPAGLRALCLARGEDEPLRPREPHEELTAEIELPEGTAGTRLERALELLIDSLLSLPQRRDRTLLGLRLGARLGGEGGWSVEQGLGRPTAAAGALRSALVPRLEELPAPAVSLRLRALALAPPAADQLELSVGEEARRRRLGAALREVRAAQGPGSLFRVLPVDHASRFPERRAILTPFADP